MRVSTLSPLIKGFTLICSSHTAPVSVFIEEDIEVSKQLFGHVSYFQYELPEEGMTLRLKVEMGRVVLYASTRIPNPNSALYDIRLETSSTEDVFLSPEDLLTSEGGMGRRSTEMAGSAGRKRSVEGRGATNTTIFVTTEGLKGDNSYVLETTFGDTSTSES